MANFNYQQIRDIVAKSGGLQQPQSETPNSNNTTASFTGEVVIDLTKYQQAVLALDFKEETDQTFNNTISAQAADPSVEEQLGIDSSGKNTYIPNAAGGSLIFNGDRVVINAKDDYAMLLGQKGVAIASPNQVNIDSQKTITLFGHERVYLGLPNRGGKQPKDSARISTPSVGHPTQDELYEPMVLGVKLANLIEDLIVTLENSQIATPTGLAVFQPSTLAELELVKTRIPEILSNYAYVDGISHEQIDQDRLNSVLKAKAAAEDFVPPTKLTGTVTGTVVLNPGAPAPQNPVTSPFAQLPGFYETPNTPPYGDSL